MCDQCPSWAFDPRYLKELRAKVSPLIVFDDEMPDEHTDVVEVNQPPDSNVK